MKWCEFDEHPGATRNLTVFLLNKHVIQKNHSLHHRVKSHDMFFKVKVVKETDDKKTTLGIGMDNYTCLAVLCFLDG